QPPSVPRQPRRLRAAGGAIARRLERRREDGDEVLLAAAPAVSRRLGQVAAEAIVGGGDPRRWNGYRRRAPGGRALARVQRGAGTFRERRCRRSRWFCCPSVRTRVR